MSQLRSKYYRVSVKALVLNEAKDKFLILRQTDSLWDWDLPGGGLVWGENAHSGLKREIIEEMSVKTSRIADRPSYFLGGFQMSREQDVWVVNIIYETELETLDFTPTDECQEIKFISLEDLKSLEKVPPTVLELAEQFRPENHTGTLV
jgi:8-oxo-dGTP diphosphatase